MSNLRTRLLVSVCGCAAASASAIASCPPGWDGAPGTPGATGGYVDPFVWWDDGNGADMYLGGSFQTFGGQATPYFLKRESDDGTYQSVGGGISGGLSSAFVTRIVPFNVGGGESLIVGGFWDNAAGVTDSASLARWDGTDWHNLGAGWNGAARGTVWSMTVWNNELYVGGQFVDLGPLTGANGIAKWDGTTWSKIGDGYTTGIGPGVFAIQPFDDGSGEKLYVAGRFTVFGNASNSAIVARWNGTEWEGLGDGLGRAATFAGAEAMVVFDDGTGPALYVGGRDIIAGAGVYNVVKWDGTEWTGVGQNLGPRTTTLTVWDDGTGPALYAGGSQLGSSLLTRLEGNTWVTYEGGVGGTNVDATGNPSVFELVVHEGDLWVGGTFTGVGPGAAISTKGLARYAACAGCPADLSGSSDPNDPAYGVPDGQADSSDFFYYLDQFVGGNLAVADISGSSDPNDPAYGVPDGNVDASDFFYYLDLFVAGCP